MNRLLKRIAIHGSLAAVILGLLGLLYAEMAGTWILSVSKPAFHSSNATPSDPMRDIDPNDTIHRRVPLSMAFWGFTFVALGELLMYLRRGHPKSVQETKPVPEADAEKLLEELLQQVEAAAKAKMETVPSVEPKK